MHLYCECLKLHNCMVAGTDALSCTVVGWKISHVSYSYNLSLWKPNKTQRNGATVKPEVLWVDTHCGICTIFTSLLSQHLIIASRHGGLPAADKGDLNQRTQIRVFLPWLLSLTAHWAVELKNTWKLCNFHLPAGVRYKYLGHCVHTPSFAWCKQKVTWIKPSGSSSRFDFI